jgi:signal transduction histidine kinase
MTAVEEERLHTGEPEQQPKIPGVVRNSIVFVQFVIPFAAGWFILALAIGAEWLAAAGAFATVGFVTGWVLHRLEWHLIARVVWLSSANIAIVVASFVTPPEGHMSLIFVASAAIPFLIFSVRTEQGWAGISVMWSIAFWLLGWFSDYRLLGGYDPELAQYSKLIALASAVTIFGVVLFVVGFYSRVSTRQLQRIRQARQAAESASAAKTALLQSMSHEMRTPLHSISGYAELLNADAREGRQNSDEDLLRYTDQILKSSRDMLKMVENMIDYASVNSSAPSPRLSDIDVQAPVAQLLGSVASELAEKDLKIDNRVQSGLVVRSDVVMLQGVLKQILENAIKFSPPEGTIHIVTRDRAGGQLEIAISDEGPGFPVDPAGTRIQPFDKRGRANGVIPGVGVGLALAQTYASAIDAKLRLGNGPEGGAEVGVVIGRTLPQSTAVKDGSTAAR